MNQKIALVIPTLNEEATIKEQIMRAKKENVSIYVIDGLSTDNTVMIAKEEGVNVLFQKGRGKGDAIRFSIMKLADEYDYICFIDGDLTYNINEIGVLMNEFKDNSTDIVIGNRLNKKREKGSITFLNTMGNYIFSILVTLLYWTPWLDTQSGYRIFNRRSSKLMKETLKRDGFEIETEMIIIASRHNLKLKSIDIQYFCRPDNSITKLYPLKTCFRIISTIFSMIFYRPKF
ncbi:MAG: glycosyltransferase [Candidatus Heimdallarchaeota archaeon]|nr:glycosyltransferase [Candidatus Heimdallarchaeota archaeon]